jgi:hypothetical protein
LQIFVGFVPDCPAEFSADVERRSIGLLLDDIVAVEKEGIPFDGDVILRARVIMVIGDFPQQQSFCGCSTSWQANRPCRRCLVTKVESGAFSTSAGQQLRRIADTIAKVSAARGGTAAAVAALKADSITTRVVHPLHRYDFADTEHGVHARAPQDHLHQMPGGNCKKVVGLVVKLLRHHHRGTAKAADRAIEKLHARLRQIPPGIVVVGVAGGRDRRYLISFGGGAAPLSAAQLTASQYAALCFQLPFAFGEDPDDEIIPAPHHRRVLQALLAIQRLYVAVWEPQAFGDQEFAEINAAIINYLQCMREAFSVLPSGKKGGVGLNLCIPKVHSLFHKM